MSEITLQVGKTYEVRDIVTAVEMKIPPIHKIIEDKGGEDFPMVSDYGYNFNRNGLAVGKKSLKSPADLVREVTEATTSKQE